jgi:tRNA(fMet)-specific endonuclease VapC
MDYLLDTNICIHYFKGQFEIKEKIQQFGYDKFAISEITLANCYMEQRRAKEEIKMSQ